MAVVKKLMPIDMSLEQLYTHEKFTPTIRKAILLKEDFSKDPGRLLRQGLHIAWTYEVPGQRVSANVR